MQKRYQIGFSDGATCGWLQENKGRPAIVDTKSFSYFGTCIALAEDDVAAQTIVDALNFIEELKDKLLPSKSQ